MSISYQEIYEMNLSPKLPKHVSFEKNIHIINRISKDEGFTQSFLDNVENECNICFEQMNGKNISITKCGHTFCFDCMIKSLSVNTTCPICRENLILDKLSFQKNNEIIVEEEGYDSSNDLIEDRHIQYISNLNYEYDDNSDDYSKIYDLKRMNELKFEFKNTIRLYLDMLSYRKIKKYKNCSLKSFQKIPFFCCCNNAKKDIYNIFFSHNKDLYHFAYTNIVNNKKVKHIQKKNSTKIKPRFRF